MAWLGTVWPNLIALLALPAGCPALKSQPAWGSPDPLPPEGPGCPWVRFGEGAFPLRCEKPPPPHTAPSSFKSHKAAEKNDGRRGNEPRRKLTLTQGAARLSADREGRLAHKTKHLNSPLYNNYSALNASSPCPGWSRPALPGDREDPQGS